MYDIIRMVSIYWVAGSLINTKIQSDK